MALEFTEENFESEVLSATVPVVVDFSAAWCGPCKMLTPIIDQLATEYGDRVKIGKVDIDQNQGIAGQYGITSVPSVLFFKGGEQVDSFVGLKPKAAIQAIVDGLL